jgi:hypothetical protein
MTKPTTKSGTNHAIGSATLPSTRSFPLMAAPVITATAVSPICAKARIVHAMTLPNMSTRAEVDASRISTIRDCFSSTTEDAIVFPNVMAAMKNTSPSPRPMKEVSVGSGASGSRSSTSGVRLSEAMSDSGAERRESTARPVGESGDSTTAASTSSAVTRALASFASSTSTGSMSSMPATACADAEVTATLSVDENRDGSAPETPTSTPRMTMERIVEIMKALDLRRTMISRSMTRPMAVVNPALFVTARLMTV